jgi:hypothetical protein
MGLGPVERASIESVRIFDESPVKEVAESAPRIV